MPEPPVPAPPSEEPDSAQPADHASADDEHALPESPAPVVPVFEPYTDQPPTHQASPDTGGIPANVVRFPGGLPQPAPPELPEPELGDDAEPRERLPRWFGIPGAPAPTAHPEEGHHEGPSAEMPAHVEHSSHHEAGVCPENDPASPEFAASPATIRAVRSDSHEDAPDADTAIAEIAYHALLIEAELTPKPGLVDSMNSGCHSDMDIWTFRASAWAIRPWLQRMVVAGAHYPVADIGHDPASAASCMADLRRLGIECERAMFASTGGVNTHRGAIYALGLLCGAAGRVLGARRAKRRPQSLLVDDLCWEASFLARPDAERDLVRAKDPTYEPMTDGERAYRDLGLPGARGEAASGFASVREVALPAYRRVQAATGSCEAAAIEALMWLYAVNADTTVATDGGMEAVFYVRDRACRWLAAGGMQAPDAFARLRDMDRDFIEMGVSPGGCADLLAVTWFLAALAE